MRHRYRGATNWLTTRETETPRNGFPLVEARSELAPVGFYFANFAWTNSSFWLFWKCRNHDPLEMRLC